MNGILLDDDGNLKIQHGTLAIGNNELQCVQLLVGSSTGEFLHAPKLGGNAKQMICGKPDPFWRGSIMEQLKQCLIEVSNIAIDQSGISIEIK